MQNASIENDAKHLIDHVSNLIINFYHHASGHSGVKYTLQLTRQKYWITGVQSKVCNEVNTGFDCRRRQAPVMQQKMANLPEN